MTVEGTSCPSPGYTVHFLSRSPSPTPGPSLDGGHVVGATTAPRNALLCLPARICTCNMCTRMHVSPARGPLSCACVQPMEGSHARDIGQEQGGGVGQQRLCRSPRSLLTRRGNRSTPTPSMLLLLRVSSRSICMSGVAGKVSFGVETFFLETSVGCPLGRIPLQPFDVRLFHCRDYY